MPIRCWLKAIFPPEKNAGLAPLHGTGHGDVSQVDELYLDLELPIDTVEIVGYLDVHPSL